MNRFLLGMCARLLAASEADCEKRCALLTS